MKIVLLNLLDSMMSGAAAFIFFQTILGKKKSQLPYYIILLIFVCSFTIYAAITSIFNWQYIDTGSLFTFNLIIFTLFLPKFSLFSQFAN